MRKCLTPTVVAFLTITSFAGTAFAAGAIAVNDEQGMSAAEAGYGLGYGTTDAEASENAVNECKSAGNDTCKVVLNFEQCGAYAGDKVKYATGVGETEKAAEAAAIGACPNCKLVVADCQ